MPNANATDYFNAADAIFSGGAFGALNNASSPVSTGGIITLPSLPPIKYNPIPGTTTGGSTSNPSGYGQGIVEWILVLVAVIALVVAYEADSRVGSGLLIIIVLLMLYSAHGRGLV